MTRANSLILLTDTLSLFRESVMSGCQPSVSGKEAIQTMKTQTQRRGGPVRPPVIIAGRQACYRASAAGRCSKCGGSALPMHSPLHRSGVFCGGCCPVCGPLEPEEPRPAA